MQLIVCHDLNLKNGILTATIANSAKVSITATPTTTEITANTAKLTNTATTANTAKVSNATTPTTTATQFNIQREYIQRLHPTSSIANFGRFQ